MGTGLRRFESCSGTSTPEASSRVLRQAVEVRKPSNPEAFRLHQNPALCGVRTLDDSGIRVYVRVDLLESRETRASALGGLRSIHIEPTLPGESTGARGAEASRY